MAILVAGGREPRAFWALSIAAWVIALVGLAVAAAMVVRVRDRPPIALELGDSGGAGVILGAGLVGPASLGDLGAGAVVGLVALALGTLVPLALAAAVAVGSIGLAATLRLGVAIARWIRLRKIGA